ncbi:MAG: GDP-mannose 4,6-dehydratase [Alphaproteobacteria bacterium]|nr:GDP-mannose 4,6-dehydratase [Alphaproteobacteria bacterium]
MRKKTAFITGITGQDGAYLARFLLDKGYRVHGLVRWDSYVDSSENIARLKTLGIEKGDITLHYGDLTDAQNITALISHIKPDEIYNLAALSQVGVSFETPASVMDINTKGCLAILETVKLLKMEKLAKIYQASSSEMFGNSPPPQNENTAFAPCSPYGVAKLASYWLVKTYRSAYGMFAVNGILFNHESPLRGDDFVTRKITRSVAAIEAGMMDELRLGNLDAKRDWGHAMDYVRGMWMMMQHDSADDFVLATGQSCTVREFVTLAFHEIGTDIIWKGSGLKEKGYDRETGKTLVSIDPALFRPKDVHNLLGDSSKARDILGWTPSYTISLVLKDMIRTDRTELRIEKALEKYDQPILAKRAPLSA